MGGLVGDDADGLAAEAREADEDVLRVVLLHLEQLAVVDHRADHRVHVVGLVGLPGHEVVEGGVFAVDRVGLRPPGRVVEVVAGHVPEEVADQREARLVVGHHEVRDAALRVVGHRPAELLLRHLLEGHGADDVGPGDEHVAGLVHHHREVGDGRRVDGAPRARPHDGGYLRHHPRREGVPQEDVGIAAQRQHPFLDARPARVVQADDGRARLHRHVHDLDDLGGVGLGQRAPEHREVLGEGVDQPSLDPPAPRDDAVAGHDLVFHAEVAAAVRDELVHLLEGARIEEAVDALARGELAGRVLAGEAGLAAALVGAALVVLEQLVLVHRSMRGRSAGRASSPAGAPWPSPQGSAPGRCRSGDG